MAESEPVSTHSGSDWVLALALVSLKLETEPILKVALKTNQFLYVVTFGYTLVKPKIEPEPGCT